MLKQTAAQGSNDALKTFGLIKTAAGLNPGKRLPLGMSVHPPGSAPSNAIPMWHEGPSMSSGMQSPGGAPHAAGPVTGSPQLPASTGASMGSGWGQRAGDFARGQMGAAKDLFGNLRQGLGGAATAEAGATARGGALGNLRTLAPTLAAGGAMYMLHHHNQAKEQQRQQQMLMGGGGYGM